MFGLYPVNKGTVYSEEEERLILETSQALQTIFLANPGTSLLEEDFESRCEAIEDLSERLIEIYDMENVNIIVTDDPEIFSDESGLHFGTTVYPGTIYINANILRLDDPVMLEHIVSTVIHELRHVMQYQIMTLKKTYGVPYQRRSLWRYNITHYISCSEDFEGYRKQAIEEDARNFTNRIWQTVYKRHVK